MSSESSTTSSSTPSSSTDQLSSTRRTTFPSVFLSHGGGPSYFMTVPRSHPFFGVSAGSPNADWLRQFASTYRLDGVNAPRAIVVVSAHFETRGKRVHVTSKKRHTRLNYDYGGFPRETYELKYEVSGDEALSRSIVESLAKAGIEAELDTKWEFDHGVFIPLKMIFPNGDIPIVEVSIDASYSPEWHLSVGRALAHLKNDGVLLIGSGSSTHNFQPNERANAAFMSALEKTIEGATSHEELTKSTVLNWQQLPSARSAHPVEDHFVPYFVIAGAAEGQHGRVVGKVEPAGAWHLASVIFE